jgi:hypothetical protein
MFQGALPMEIVDINVSGSQRLWTISVLCLVVMSGKRPRVSLNATDLPFSDVFCDFLEPFLHHALRLGNVYEPLLFEEVLAYGVRVWRCNHPKIADYLKTVVVACKRNIDDGKLCRVKVCFYDEDRRKLDEVCVRLASFPKVDEKNAVAIHNWFRESLLVLESRMCKLPLASSFQVELVCTGQMFKDTNWLLVEGRDGGSQDPAVVETVREASETVHMEVFIKRHVR